MQRATRAARLTKPFLYFANHPNFLIHVLGAGKTRNLSSADAVGRMGPWERRGDRRRPSSSGRESRSSSSKFRSPERSPRSRRRRSIWRAFPSFPRTASRWPRSKRWCLILNRSRARYFSTGRPASARAGCSRPRPICWKNAIRRTALCSLAPAISLSAATRPGRAGIPPRSITGSGTPRRS